MENAGCSRPRRADIAMATQSEPNVAALLAKEGATAMEVDEPAATNSQQLISAAIATPVTRRKTNFSDRVTISLRDALGLTRNKDLEELERSICCKFTLDAQSWNTYDVLLFGTEIGVRKGRNMLMAKVESRRQLSVTVAATSNGVRPQAHGACFNRLPHELKQMIVNRVLWSKGDDSLRGDGRRLLELRRVNKIFKVMVEREMIVNERRCSKRVLYLTEDTSGAVRLGFSPINAKITVTFAQLDHLLSMINCSTSAKQTPPSVPTKHSEVYIKCDFRRSWCHEVLAMLLKHDNIQPEVLKARGVLCDGKMFKRFVEARPSLNHLFFEKPLCDANFFRHRFFAYRTYAFNNLGPQDRSPENVRNNYSIYHGFHRNPNDLPAHHALHADVAAEYL